MTRSAGRLVPFAVGLLGVALITGAIGAVRPWLDLPNLTAAYLLLVLWLGARFGWPSAVFAAVLAFLVYEWFFVPPYGSILISAARDIVNLVLLLAFALAGGRLTATIAARMAGARAQARESGTLYNLAVAALRDPHGTSALSELCAQARAGGPLTTVALVDMAGGRPAIVAGDELPADQLRQARWAYDNHSDLGARLRDGQLVATKTHPPHTGPVYIVLGGGVAVLGLPPRGPEEDGRRLLAALLGLAGLLLDRGRVTEATERARELEASDRLKAAVLSSISHELKSPIASLRAGLTTLLIPKAGRAADLRDMVAGLDGQAARLDRLVTDLLAMSRLEAGLPLELHPHALDEMTGTVLHSLDARLRGFDVEVDLPQDLPPVPSDEILVERVVANLLENAAAWTEKGGRITIGARPEDDHVEVWVENQGPAIPDGELELVFDKFWTSREGGSGLGLAICRRAIEAHGGRIRVENAASGPRFTFTLPLAERPVPGPR